MHSQCHMSHNNVQLSSIFVSNGRWVLGGMEFTGTVAESKVTGLTSILSKELVPPEHQGQGSSSVMTSSLRTILLSFRKIGANFGFLI